jgi:hypothetical protein
LNKLGRHPLEDVCSMLTLSSSSKRFLKEDFLSFYYIHKGKNNDPWGEADFDQRDFI